MIPRRALVLALLSLPLLSASAADRPNVLWITAEDLSPALGAYGDPDAKTPKLDAFAKDAVVFDAAIRFKTVQDGVVDAARKAA